MGADNHSLEELNKALDGLDGEELYRLTRAAGRLVRGLPIEPRELVDETSARFREGRRNWNRAYPFRVVFWGAMRSVAHEMREDESAAPFGAKTEEEAEELEGRLADEETPEQQLSAKQLLSALERDLGNDDQVQKVIDGRMEGLTAQEVQNKTGMSATEYDAARKRLDRWYEKVSREGADR